MLEHSSVYLVDSPEEYRNHAGTGMLRPNEIKVRQIRDGTAEVLESTHDGAAIRDVDISVLQQLIDEDVLLLVEPVPQ